MLFNSAFEERKDGTKAHELKAKRFSFFGGIKEMRVK